MSAGTPPGAARACAACLRRSRLLAEMGPRLEIRSRRRGRLLELLALGDNELAAVVGVVRSAQAESASARPARSPPPERVCRHDSSYPPSLADDGGPRVLHVRGGAERLRMLAARPAVAVCGSSRTTDYGIEVASAIAGELAADGVTLISALADPAGAAAQRSAVAAGGAAVAVLACGHDTGGPAARRALARRVAQRGCVIAELPQGCDGRVWGRIAAARVIARLASVTLIVEADDTPVDMAPAEVARALGRTLAAVPGRVTSPPSRGAHALLRDGAHLARGAADVLALLGGGFSARPRPQRPLDRGLLETLELVGAGCDTPEKLERRERPAQSVLLELSRLELLGLLVRGDGGRYVVRGGHLVR